jgi:transcriptional regulator with XRE-family HTH domain
MNLERERIRLWLRRVLEQTGDSPTALAKKAGLAQSTLTRFLHSDDAPLLGLRSITKIAQVAKVSAPGFDGGEAKALAGFQEDEAVPFVNDAQSQNVRIKAAVAAIIGTRQAVDPWVMKTDALKFAGYLRGDILIVDLSRVPNAGEIACAQVYNWEKGQAGTVFRIYEPPYLIAASDDAAMRRPLLVDNNQVILKGVVTESLRLSVAQ